MRAIDADALIEEIQHYIDEAGWSIGHNEALRWCIEFIEHAHTIEPERKPGKWVPVDSYSAFGGDEATWAAHVNPTAFHYCSVCKEQAYADEEGKEILSDFCPHCGSPMAR